MSERARVGNGARPSPRQRQPERVWALAYAAHHHTLCALDVAVLHHQLWPFCSVSLHLGSAFQQCTRKQNCNVTTLFGPKRESANLVSRAFTQTHTSTYKHTNTHKHTNTQHSTQTETNRNTNTNTHTKHSTQTQTQIQTHKHAGKNKATPKTT